MSSVTPVNNLAAPATSLGSTQEHPPAVRTMLRARLWCMIADHARPAAVAGWERLIDDLVDVAAEDLHATVTRDPAAGSSIEVLAAYRCFQAVLAYRIAHAVTVNGVTAGIDSASECRIIARRLSEKARVDSGVELHPAASIGRRFVVDHGTGTVVGETVRIGDDCYVLQGVVLGSVRIADNPSGIRHPTLGDRVEVGSFARVLGPVVVGNDVVIGCHTLVREDVPDGARVSVLHEMQVVRAGADLHVTGVEKAGPYLVRLRGRGLDAPGLVIECLSPADHLPEPAPVNILSAGRNALVVHLGEHLLRRHTHLLVRAADGASVSVRLPVQARDARTAR